MDQGFHVSLSASGVLNNGWIIQSTGVCKPAIKTENRVLFQAKAESLHI
jgi:hypothetical protein